MHVAFVQLLDRLNGVDAWLIFGTRLESRGEHTTMGAVAVMYGDKGYLFHKSSSVAKKIEAWISADHNIAFAQLCTQKTTCTTST